LGRSAANSAERPFYLNISPHVAAQTTDENQY